MAAKVSIYNSNCNIENLKYSFNDDSPVINSKATNNCGAFPYNINCQPLAVTRDDSEPLALEIMNTTADDTKCYFFYNASSLTSFQPSVCEQPGQDYFFWESGLECGTIPFPPQVTVTNTIALGLACYTGAC